MSQPYQWTKDEVDIIKRCWRDDGGRLALQLVVERLGNLHGSSFAENALEMAHGEGRRWVARALMHAINVPLSAFNEESHESGRRISTTTERRDSLLAAASQRTE